MMNQLSMLCVYVIVNVLLFVCYLFNCLLLMFYVLFVACCFSGLLFVLCSSTGFSYSWAWGASRAGILWKFCRDLRRMPFVEQTLRLTFVCAFSLRLCGEFAENAICLCEMTNMYLWRFTETTNPRKKCAEIYQNPGS